MSRKAKRLSAVFFLLLGVGVATWLVLSALRDNVSYFRTPTDIVSGRYPERATGRGLRIGGMVVKGSLVRSGDRVTFEATDLVNSVTVTYQGIVPDLFREGQGVVAEGKMNADGIFVADRILAKHDEKYMPPEVTDALQRAKMSVPEARP